MKTKYKIILYAFALAIVFTFVGLPAKMNVITQNQDNIFSPSIWSVSFFGLTVYSEVKDFISFNTEILTGSLNFIFALVIIVVISKYWDKKRNKNW